MKLLFFLVILASVSSFPESGKFSLTFNEENAYRNNFVKSMFNQTSISIVLDSLCLDHPRQKFEFEFGAVWVTCFENQRVEVSDCSKEKSIENCLSCQLGFASAGSSSDATKNNGTKPLSSDNSGGKTITAFFKTRRGEIDCDKHSLTLKNETAVNEMGNCSEQAVPNSGKGSEAMKSEESTDEDKTEENKDTSGDDKNKDTTGDDKNKVTTDDGENDTVTPSSQTSSTTEALKSGKNKKIGDSDSRRKRAVAGNAQHKNEKNDQKKKEKKPASKAEVKSNTGGKISAAVASQNEKNDELLTKVWKDGQYNFLFRLKPLDEEYKPEKPITLLFKTRDDRGGMLSEADFPLLYFYLVMTIVYVLLGFTWLLLLACYWRDLLRIQYYMALVILLGLLEKVFYYSEYEHVDKNGESSKTMVIVAELISKLKMTLTLALVVIVSVGFGLVKPRLGPTLHKLLAVCFIYFILSSVEGCLRVMRTRQDVNPGQSDIIALIPLALCEVGIIYWVFSSLLQTIRTLRLRRNVTKLSLYRHFTNLLIFCLLASLGYLIWFFKQLRFTDCIRDIREMWLEKGFWPMLFTVMLMVIMVLWRPSINNQRYSHSPLLGEGEDDEEEGEDTLMMSEAFDAKKRSQANGSAPKDKRKSREEKVEDDLRWIEDNIPASVADSALPALNDSEEEIMTTRFELSKMD